MSTSTPQEKKRKSLLKDRRNVYGESPHSARKSIPLNKRKRSRAERQAGTVRATSADDETAIDKASARAQLKRTNLWKKLPDAPLKVVIEHKKKRRRD